MAILVILGAVAVWLFGYDEPRVRLARADNGCPGCDLREASMWWIKLIEADFKGADMSGATMWWTDLQRADLRQAKFVGANLWWSDLRGAR
ncbi:MAG: pentapeptide repeat-containing protein, partial [Alphaproteobacteria bacterium]|nr:pentapeptide repeat-containing protein [Alphaproteobacteria bacterium]